MSLSYVFFYYYFLIFPLKNPKNPLSAPSKIQNGWVLMGNSDFLNLFCYPPKKYLGPHPH